MYLLISFIKTEFNNTPENSIYKLCDLYVRVERDEYEGTSFFLRFSFIKEKVEILLNSLLTLEVGNILCWFVSRKSR